MNNTTTIRINGGNPLNGEVTVAPNKNAILPALAASILTKDWMTYYNVPKSPDVEKILQTLEEMGVHIYWENKSLLRCCCAGVKTFEVPNKYVQGIQAGYLFAGPLLARFGEAVIPFASGCRLGYRGPEDHLEYLESLGVHATLSENTVHLKLGESIKENRPVISKDESLYQKRSAMYSNPCVTPTENILMLLAATSGFETELSGIAQEPHVVQLTDLLRAMGAKITGKGSIISVIGSDYLKGARFITEPDHVDYFGFAILAAMTKGDILLRMPTPLSPGITYMNKFLTKMGIVFQEEFTGIRIYGSKSLFSPVETFPKADKDTFKMNPGPWPMFPVDCLPMFIAWSTMNPNPVTATRVQNWAYTDGLKYVSTMKEMGARILSHDEQRVLIGGVPGGNPYQASTIVTAPDVIEGGRAVISCALAGGKHVIQNAQYVLRRNPNYFDILEELGADITIENSEMPAELVV